MSGETPRAPDTADELVKVEESATAMRKPSVTIKNDDQKEAEKTTNLKVEVQ